MHAQRAAHQPDIRALEAEAGLAVEAVDRHARLAMRHERVLATRPVVAGLDAFACSAHHAGTGTLDPRGEVTVTLFFHPGSTHVARRTLGVGKPLERGAARYGLATIRGCGEARDRRA
jgi:hypothetical protein